MFYAGQKIIFHAANLNCLYYYISFVFLLMQFKLQITFTIAIIHSLRNLVLFLNVVLHIEFTLFTDHCLFFLLHLDITETRNQHSILIFQFFRDKLGCRISDKTAVFDSIGLFLNKWRKLLEKLIARKYMKYLGMVFDFT